MKKYSKKQILNAISCSDENSEKLDEGISSIEISGESTATAWKADENTYRIAFG